jgi:hypothetical protein
MKGNVATTLVFEKRSVFIAVPDKIIVPMPMNTVSSMNVTVCFGYMNRRGIVKPSLSIAVVPTTL